MRNPFAILNPRNLPAALTFLLSLAALVQGRLLGNGRDQQTLEAHYPVSGTPAPFPGGVDYDFAGPSAPPVPSDHMPSDMPMPSAGPFQSHDEADHAADPQHLPMPSPYH